MSSYGQVYAAAIASVMETAVLQNAATGNGNGTSMTVAGYSTLVLGITASVAMSGGTTVNFEGTIDDTTWVPLLGTNVGTTVTATNTTEQGDWVFSVVGYSKVRARISSYSAGTITVKGVVSALSSSGTGGGGGGSGNVNINQIAGNTPAVNNGAANNGTLRVAIASDNAGIVSASQSGTWNINNVSGTVSLPTGAATAAKQPTLGTAGSASSDVITVQGIASMTALKVDGSAVTQPISASSLPLPTGASTAAKQPALGTAGSASSDVITVQGIASMTALKVDGSAVTQPVSASSLPLPTGASTSAKQPALGTAGSASADVITVQGIASMIALKVDGSAVTQPVSATSLPLPSGAATSAKQPALGSAGSAATDVITVQGIASMTALKIDGSATTQPVSASSLPLPTGAATSAKQPALGTAGSAASDVITVQGIASMTPLKIDGSGSTQPVSGSVTANAGTNLNTSALALESGGNLATIAGAISSSKVQANLVQIGGVSVSTGNGSSGAGVQRITIADDSSGQIALTASKVPAVTAMQTNVSSNQNGTSLSLAGYAQAVVSITGTFTATVNFEASVDGGTTWVAILGTSVSSGTSASTTTAAGDWTFAIAGYSQMRARISGWASGSVTVKGYASVIGSSSAQSGSSGSVNISQVGGTAVSTGNGSTGSGVQRVTLSDDGTGQIALTASKTPSTTTLQNAVSSNGNGTSMTVTGYGSVVLSVTGSIGGGTTVNFEASTDGGTTWVSILGVKTGSSLVSSSTTALGDWVISTGGYNQIRARVSSYSSGTVTVKGYASVIPASNVFVNQTQNAENSYMACSNYFTPANNATDMFRFYGSSTKTIKILKVEVDYKASSGGSNTFFLIKYSDQSGTGGTSTALTAIPLSSANPASSANMIRSYTANPGDSTAVGIINLLTAPCAWAGDASRVPPQSKNVLFDHKTAGQPLTLSGTSEGIAVNNQGVTVAGTSKLVSVTIYWTES